MNQETTTEPKEQTPMIPVGDQLLGRLITGRGEPLDGGASLADAPRVPIFPRLNQAASRAASPRMLHTGIKVIDLFAPVVRGGLIGLFAGAGMGKIVVMQELIYVVAQRGGRTVCFGLEERTHAADGFMLEMRSGGVHDKLAMVLAKRDEAEHDRERALLAAITLAEQFDRPDRDVLLFIDVQCTPLLTRDAVRTRLEQGALTTLLFGTPDDLAALPSSITLDTTVIFSLALAKQQLWPAVDPLRSRSNLLDPQFLGQEHVEVAQRAHDLLRHYADLHEIVETRGIDALAEEDRTVAMRARRVQRFLTQPFAVAEPWTGIPGETVPLADTIKGVAAIMAGRYDDVPEDALHFIGAIEHIA